MRTAGRASGMATLRLGGDPDSAGDIASGAPAAGCGSGESKWLSTQEFAAAFGGGLFARRSGRRVLTPAVDSRGRIGRRINGRRRATAVNAANRQLHSAVHSFSWSVLVGQPRETAVRIPNS